MNYKDLLSIFPIFKVVEEGKPDKSRMQDVEMVLRFLYLLESYSESSLNRLIYPKKEQLNFYMKAKKELEKGNKDFIDSYTKSHQELEDIFNKTCQMVKITFKGKHFRKFGITNNTAKFSSSFNKAFFDIQLLGFIDYEVESIEKITDIIYNEFIELCCFNSVMSDNTNDKITERVNTWKNLLLNIVTDDNNYYTNKLDRKIEHFNISQICHSCSEKIETVDESYCDLENNAFYHIACYIKDNKAPTERKSVSHFDFNSLGTDIDVSLSYCGRNSNGVTIHAQGVITKSGVIVKSGSEATLNNSSSLGTTINLKNKLINQGILIEQDNILLFMEDYLFNSFSASATIILGGCVNGKEVWKTSDGKTLKELGF